MQIFIEEFVCPLHEQNTAIKTGTKEGDSTFKVITECGCALRLKVKLDAEVIE